MHGPNLFLPTDVKLFYKLSFSWHIKISVLKLIKHRALPGYKGDEDDLRFLIRKMEIRTFKEIQDWIHKYYLDDVPSSSDRSFLEQLIGEVNA